MLLVTLWKHGVSASLLAKPVGHLNSARSIMDTSSFYIPWTPRSSIEIHQTKSTKATQKTGSPESYNKDLVQLVIQLPKFPLHSHLNPLFQHPCKIPPPRGDLGSFLPFRLGGCSTICFHSHHDLHCILHHNLYRIFHLCCMQPTSPWFLGYCCFSAILPSEIKLACCAPRWGTSPEESLPRSSEHPCCSLVSLTAGAMTSPLPLSFDWGGHVALLFPLHCDGSQHR